MALYSSVDRAADVFYLTLKQSRCEFESYQKLIFYYFSSMLFLVVNQQPD